MADRLLASGRAYRCTCPPSAEGAAHQRERCACADRDPAAVPADVPASVRFRAPDEGAVVVPDVVRGEVRFPAQSIEDVVLLRSDGRPTYNFAAVCDDAQMRITHVIRGADHLINTPKQLLVYQALGYEPPVFAHVPLILGEDRQKLSKRHGATSVAEHRRLGYVAEALFNYLSLLGWSSPSGDEFLRRERLIDEIDLERVGTSDAIFDRDKLRWLSSKYIHEMPLEELAAALEPWIDRARFPIAAEALPSAVAGVRDHLATFAEVNDHLGGYLGPHTEAQQEARAALLRDAEAKRVLTAVGEALAELPEWTEEAIGVAIRAGGTTAGAKGRALFHPLRVALTGEEKGPELPRIVRVLGRDRVLELLHAGPAAEGTIV
jgi:glutamyl-tRNA synthetase